MGLVLLDVEDGVGGALELETGAGGGDTAGEGICA